MMSRRAVLTALRSHPRNGVISLRRYATPANPGQEHRYLAPAEEPEPEYKNQENSQVGDYPHLSNTSRQTLPAYGWWDQQNRRNYGDPLHEQEDIVGMWGPDAPHVPPPTALKHFGVAVLCWLAFAFSVSFFVPKRDAVPRSYPYDGLLLEQGGLEANKAPVYEPEDSEE